MSNFLGRLVRNIATMGSVFIALIGGSIALAGAIALAAAPAFMWGAWWLLLSIPVAIVLLVLVMAALNMLMDFAFEWAAE